MVIAVIATVISSCSKSNKKRLTYYAYCAAIKPDCHREILLDL